jgi:hypothetical protein
MSVTSIALLSYWMCSIPHLPSSRPLLLSDVLPPAKDTEQKTLT